VLAENDDDEVDGVMEDVFSDDSDIDDDPFGSADEIIRGRVIWWLQRTLMYRK
jgi:hypothetical protein